MSSLPRAGPRSIRAILCVARSSNGPRRSGPPAWWQSDPPGCDRFSLTEEADPGTWTGSSAPELSRRHGPVSFPDKINRRGKTASGSGSDPYFADLPSFGA